MVYCRKRLHNYLWVAPLVVSSNTVAHNLAVWLLRSVQTDEPFTAAASMEAVQSLVADADLKDEERAAAISKLEKVASLPVNVIANGPMFLFSYIPNYVDYGSG
jgi:hypothetical protein